MSLKRFLRNHCPSVLAWILFYKDIKRKYINPYVKIRANKDRCHESVIFELPVDISDYSLIDIGPYTKIRKNFTFLGVKGKFHLKKYSTIAMNCTVVTDGHIPTVGLPQIISGTNHVNDKCRDLRRLVVDPMVSAGRAGGVVDHHLGHRRGLHPLAAQHGHAGGRSRYALDLRLCGALGPQQDGVHLKPCEHVPSAVVDLQCQRFTRRVVRQGLPDVLWRTHLVAE